MRRRIMLVVTGVVAALVVALIVFVVMRANAPGPAALTGHSWKLTRLVVDGQEQSLTQERPPTLRFKPEDRTVSGFSGCNSYSGSYMVSGGSLHVDHLQSTLIACSDSSVMDMESAYMQALDHVESYRIEGDTLTLMGDGGKVVMTFQPGG